MVPVQVHSVVQPVVQHSVSTRAGNEALLASTTWPRVEGLLTKVLLRSRDELRARGAEAALTFLQQHYPAALQVGQEALWARSEPAREQFQQMDMTGSPLSEVAEILADEVAYLLELDRAPEALELAPPPMLIDCGPPRLRPIASPRELRGVSPSFEALVRAGCDTSLLTERGDTGRDMAQEKGHTAVLERLKELKKTEANRKKKEQKRAKKAPPGGTDGPSSAASLAPPTSDLAALAALAL